MRTRYLLLWLEGPLQSWGVDSLFGRRDTLDFPTKSALLGMLCSAMGKTGEQIEFLEMMSKMSQTVISFVHQDREREVLLSDFQMVGSGYDDKDPWELMMVPKTSEGKKAVSGGTKLTYRYYLQDSFFAAIMQIPLGEESFIVESLKNPVFDLYLGRKSCVPTDFIYQGVFDSEESAIEKSLEIAKEKNLKECFKVVDGSLADGEVMCLNDVPIQFGTRKKYRDRMVTVIQNA